MISKTNLLGAAFLFAGVLGLSTARAEGVAPPHAEGAKTGSAAAGAPAPKAGAKVKGSSKRSGKTPPPSKDHDAAATPTAAAASAPSAEKMQELQKHPEARSGRGHI